MKTFVLQKDLPDVKAGAELKYNSVLEVYDLFISQPKENVPSYRYNKTIVENDDGTWFKLKKEPKNPVTHVHWSEDLSELTFNIGNSGVLQVVIKNERLAEILIAESKGRLSILPDDGIPSMDEIFKGVADDIKNKKLNTAEPFTKKDIVKGMKIMTKAGLKCHVERVLSELDPISDTDVVSVELSSGQTLTGEGFVRFINNGIFKIVTQGTG